MLIARTSLDKGNLTILCGRSVIKWHRHDDVPHILSILLQDLSSIIKLKRVQIQVIAKTVRGKVYELFLSSTEVELNFVYQHVTDGACVAVIEFIATRPQIINSSKLFDFMFQLNAPFVY